MSELNKLKFQQLEIKFANEFNDVNNRQILFSGAFGSGKTTFLRDFSAEHNTTIFIHIYPVNYTLHSNTDVYEILKYDIILELISLGCFNSEDVGKLLNYAYALTHTLDEAIKKVINLFSKTGKKLIELQEIFKTSIDEFSKTKRDLNNPLLSVADFGEEIGKLKGYEYEDFITSVIKEKLALLERNAVLIVDDLDTIDPEHLFRLISIFRAHIDHHSDENKFGFDKIIFVADADNLKTMYAHRFGSSESFNGYISKLSSKDIFCFNPSKELYMNLNSFLSKIQITIKGAAGNLPFLQNSNNRVKQLAIYLIANLINVNTINLRDLVKDIELNYGENRFVGLYDEDLYDLDIYPIYILLKYYSNSLIFMKSAFRNMENNPLGLNQVFQGVQNHNRIFSDFSVSLLEAISYLPEFKEKREDDVFDLNLYGKILNIRSIKFSHSRERQFIIEDETFLARDFFQLASYCFVQFEEKIIGI